MTYELKLMKFDIRVSFLILLLLLSSCKEQRQDVLPRSDLKYAELLRLEQTDSFSVATVLSPWDKGAVLGRYVLVPTGCALPKELPEGTLLRTPLRRAVAFSSVHAALLQQLNDAQGLLGICDARYIVGDSLKKTVESGRLVDFGASVQPNIEHIIASKADALLVSPIENAGYGLVEKLGVPLIVCADYMETSGLGRAEWMRLFGLLFDCRNEADSLFRIVERDYTEFAALAAKTKRRPLLLYGLKEGAVWYVPGGRSTWAEIFRDAAVNYAFSENESSGSVAMNFEDIFAHSSEADFWMLKYGRSSNMSYTSIAEDFPAYKRLRPWRERRIFGCNTFSTPYYEDAPFRPDRLLHDLIKMAHPDLLTDSPFHYYSALDL